METKECIKGRRSCRRFGEEKVDKDTLDSIVKLASYSPSWKNTQVVRYNVVENRSMLEAIAQDCILGFEYNAKTIRGCAALVVVSVVTGRCGYERDGSYTTSKGDRWEMFDAGIAAQTFCLAAHEAGVGSVIMGIFDDSKIANVIQLPKEQQVAALIAIGYPSMQPDMPPRKEVEQLVNYIK